MGTAARNAPLPWLKPAVLTGSLVPIAAIMMRASVNALGPDPIAQALNQLGLIALVFLIAALACTPLKVIAGWAWPMRLRRMLGVLAFFYASLHVITYTVLDQGLDWRAIYDDIVKRVHLLRVFHLCLADPAGRNLDQLGAETARLRPLEAAPSSRLSGAGARGASLHVEGET